jgi:hypothetical protein
MKRIEIKYTHKSSEPGYCREYYTGPKGVLYCFQQDGYNGRDNYVWYVCSAEGEPSHEKPRPADEEFDKLVLPASLKR